jgi:hypothetical protein
VRQSICAACERFTIISTAVLYLKFHGLRVKWNTKPTVPFGGTVLDDVELTVVNPALEANQLLRIDPQREFLLTAYCYKQQQSGGVFCDYYQLKWNQLIALSLLSLVYMSLARELC